MITDDGDIVRGVGFVSIYSAHAEKDIDALLVMLNGGKPVGSKLHGKPARTKLEHALKMVRLLESSDLKNLELVLEKADTLFVRRNEIIHGRIYAGHERKDVLKSGRMNVPDRPVSSKELYVLARDFHYFSGHIQKAMPFKLPRALAGKKFSGSGTSDPGNTPNA